METTEAFDELYYKLKNRYISELGMMTLTKELIGPYLIRWRDELLNFESKEFLLKRSRQDTSDIPSFVYELPQVKYRARVIIYGGGIFGRWLFTTILRCQYYNIISWVDRNYDKLGFPFRSVESINNEEFDFILVAIKSENVFMNIKATLVHMGIEEEKICWISEIE